MPDQKRMRYFTKRYHMPGTSPGTLTSPKIKRGVPLSIKLIDFSTADFSELILKSPQDSTPFLGKASVTWIHIQGDVEPDIMSQLGKLFGLHHLALEDVINVGQRPKIDTYDEHFFMTMSHPLVDKDSDRIKIDQVSLFLGPCFVVSFHPGEHDPFEPVRERLRNKVGRIRYRGADYLLYTLLDVVIDEGFPVLEWLGEEIEKMETELLASPTHSTLHWLHKQKRELLMLRRVLWPQREVLNKLVREETPFINEATKIYFRDCYDHTIQIMDLLEIYRDTVTGLLDVYLSSISYRLNENMRVLTVIATIFIPLTFLVGVYGMNFTHADSPWAMPELHWYYGYPALWLVMICSVIGMLIFFRIKKWF